MVLGAISRFLRSSKIVVKLSICQKLVLKVNPNHILATTFMALSMPLHLTICLSSLSQSPGAGNSNLHDSGCKYFAGSSLSLFLDDLFMPRTCFWMTFYNESSSDTKESISYGSKQILNIAFACFRDGFFWT